MPANLQHVHQPCGKCRRHLPWCDPARLMLDVLWVKHRDGETGGAALRWRPVVVPRALQLIIHSGAHHPYRRFGSREIILIRRSRSDNAHQESNSAPTYAFLPRACSPRLCRSNKIGWHPMCTQETSVLCAAVPPWQNPQLGSFVHVPVPPRCSHAVSSESESKSKSSYARRNRMRLPHEPDSIGRRPEQQMSDDVVR